MVFGRAAADIGIASKLVVFVVGETGHTAGVVDGESDVAVIVVAEFAAVGFGFLNQLTAIAIFVLQYIAIAVDRFRVLLTSSHSKR